MAVRIDIGLFAHNEAAGIADMLRGLMAQDIFDAPDFSARVLVLANGCTDATVAIAQSECGPTTTVVDLPAAGKSRTWNRFVHGFAREDAHFLIFMDADIAFSTHDTLRRLVQHLLTRPDLWVINSQPIKDIIALPSGLSTIDKVIAAASGGLDDWKTAICGQLYAMPAARARAFHLPIGLPVEDGFLRAMVLTDALTREEDFSKIDGAAGISHIFASERSIVGLINHQTRIVIGSAINAVCFAQLRNLPVDQRHAKLRLVAQDDDWVGGVISHNLPKWSYGFVPVHFLVKRVAVLMANPKRLLQPRQVLIVIAGFGFDAIVYLRAQVAMARGAGSGHW